jgi:hypothetical protein
MPVAPAERLAHRNARANIVRLVQARNDRAVVEPAPDVSSASLRAYIAPRPRGPGDIRCRAIVSESPARHAKALPGVRNAALLQEARACGRRQTPRRQRQAAHHRRGGGGTGKTESSVRANRYLKTA